MKFLELYVQDRLITSIVNDHVETLLNVTTDVCPLCSYPIVIHDE